MLQELRDVLANNVEEEIGEGHSEPPSKDPIADIFFRLPPSSEVVPNDEWNRFQYEHTAPMSMNPLEWWRERAVTYPVLTSIMKRYLCIPASSATAERNFSTAGLIVNKRRGRLDPKVVDQLIFLNKA